MNVVTGVFIERALDSAEEERCETICKNIFTVFTQSERCEDGEVTCTEFLRALKDPVMQDYFSSINVDTSEAKALFELLDADMSGSLTYEELVSACLSLLGPAKALDMAFFRHEFKAVSRHMMGQLRLLVESQTNGDFSCASGQQQRATSVVDPDLSDFKTVRLRRNSLKDLQPMFQATRSPSHVRAPHPNVMLHASSLNSHDARSSSLLTPGQSSRQLHGSRPKYNALNP